MLSKLLKTMSKEDSRDFRFSYNMTFLPTVLLDSTVAEEYLVKILVIPRVGIYISF